MLEQKTGWSHDELLKRVSTSITTLGPKGVSVERRDEPALVVTTCPERVKVDPTGIGDAFRAGFLAGVSWRLGDERAAQLGCMMATFAIEAVGPQEYRFDANEFVRRFEDAYGPEGAADINP